MLVIELAGGIDSGATGNGLKEKDVVLKMALAVGKELKRHNVDVKYTRTTDRYLSLDQRTTFANKFYGKYNVIFFYSIHLNSFHKPTANGIETFAYRNSKGSQEWSKITHKEVMDEVTLRNRGTKTSGFYVLRKTKMKANLIELGFISNTKDMKYLLNNWDKAVKGVSKGILKAIGIKYKDKVIRPSKPKPKPITVKSDRIPLMLLGEPLNLHGFLRGGRHYVTVNGSHFQLREILEQLDLVVGYRKGVVTADRSNKPVKGKTDILLLGTHIKADTILYKGNHCIKVGKSYLPIRDIFESWGLTVEWNRKENMILVK